MPAQQTPLHSRQWRRDLPALLCISLLGAGIYANSLHVPWYLDDTVSIVENRSLQRLSEVFANLLAGEGQGLAELTFAVNYRLGGLDVFGYHLVNIAIHLLTSCLVFFILKRAAPGRPLLALAGALVFVAHPLQTQAVTYIVQRMASLAALFFFLALYLYIKARETPEEIPQRHWSFYGGALLCGALAVMTKQNTAVLPVGLILFDRFFLPGGRTREWPRLLLYVAPFAVAPVWSGIASLVVPMFSGAGIEHVEAMPELNHLRNLSPLHYLVTQFSVVWLYLRLLFFPVGQALEYDLPIVEAIFAWRNGLALLGIILLLATAFLLRRRLPLVAAGILWFFLGLAVESSIIPLDPIFEHRLYIPMFGLSLAVMAALAMLPNRQRTAAMVLLILPLAVLTWQRNGLWNDPIAFYQDNIERAPQSERAHLALANAYRKLGRLAEAEAIYDRALAINPDYVLIHINLSKLHGARREYEAAEAVLLDGLRRSPDDFRLYNNLAVIYNIRGRYGEAAQYLQQGIRLVPDNPAMHFSLALAYERLGRLDEAIAHYRQAVILDGTDPDHHFALGVALYSKGDSRGALQEFLMAGRLAPDHKGAIYNAALIYAELGETRTALEVASRLRQLDPQLAASLARRISQTRLGL